MTTPASSLPGRVHPEFWKGRRVFLTGHTGFKGSWLSLWLHALGAEVRGFALAPNTSPALFVEARVATGMDSVIGDVRDLDGLRGALHAWEPEVVLHLAAQPLVRLSYAEPVSTYAINVMGTIHLFEAVRTCRSVRAVVNVTTDKCYENREWVWGYREDEAMGGLDPYSSSKGCSELVTSAYRRSFFASGPVAVASARAGNVIGGGDWAADRLVPDTLRAFERGMRVTVRNPESTRPWQHVLEPLSGYLLLAERLTAEGQAVAEAFNFGPRDDDDRPVRWIVDRLAERWNGDAGWTLDAASNLHEAGMLRLDIAKASRRLGWAPKWNLGETLDRIVRWQHAWRAGTEARTLCESEIADYMSGMEREKP